MANIPKHGHKGAITPIHKKESILIPDNYRGITITSSMNNVFSTMMNCQLMLVFLRPPFEPRLQKRRKLEISPFPVYGPCCT